MQIFYAPEIQQSQTLPEEEARHCFKVLRKQQNDIITVIDGKGTFYECRLSGSSPKNHTLEVVESYKERHTRTHKLHIGIAPTKNMDRLEWFVEKAVEIGIDEISFLTCEHSERRVVKQERLLKKAINAAKQSIKATIPEMNALSPLKDVVRGDSAYSNKLIAHLHNTANPLTEIPVNSTLLLIGPEGDFSEREVELCHQYGYKSVSLGTSRLRTETAGIVGCTLLNFQA